MLMKPGDLLFWTTV